MYNENKEKSSILTIILRVILVGLIIILGIKVISIFNEKSKEKAIKNNFAENIKMLEDVSKEYFTTDMLPTESGASVKVSLKELVDKNVIKVIKDTNKKSCDMEASYIEVIKLDKQYQYKTYLLCGKEDDYSNVFVDITEEPTTTKVEPTTEPTTKKTTTTTKKTTTTTKKTTTTTTTTKPATRQVHKTVSDYFCLEGNKVEDKALSSNGYICVAKNMNNATCPANWSIYNDGECYISANVKSESVLVTETEMTVSFNANGGNTIGKIKVFSTEAIGTLPTPVRNGYTFVGWYYQDKLVNNNTIVNDNMVLIAKWTKN